MSRNRSWNVAFAFFVALVFALVSHAQAPTSRVIHYDNVQTDVLSTPGQPFRLQLFDIPTGGTPRYCEDQPLDTDATGLISFDFGAGTPSAPPCPSSPPGLNPNDFTSGESRYLDVVDPSTGTSHLTARVPVKAVGFAVNPGPQGPQGIQGPPGQQGPPGVVQTVSAGDGSIAVGGTAADRLVSVATNGVTNTHVASGALSPAKITGTAATLGPNNFVGAQNVSGNLLVSNPGGVALDGIGLVGIRGSTNTPGGFAIVGSAPANARAGQFNGPVNVVGTLSAAGGNDSGVVAESNGVFAATVRAVNTSAGCTELCSPVAIEAVSNGSNGTGVSGSGATIGVSGSGGLMGVSGSSSAGAGVDGSSSTGTGVHGASTSGEGGLFETAGATGLHGLTRSNAFFAAGVVGEAISPAGNTTRGVFGTSNSPSGIGVHGIAATGVQAETGNGNIFIGRGLGSTRIRFDATGKGFFNGGTQTGGADFAESFAVRGDKNRYEPGDLLAIDPASNRRLALADQPYSALIAGIYSTKPGVLATPYDLDDGRITKEIPLAVVGVVPCKVTTENGPIRRGDLLVASSTPGHAMKGTDRKRMLGAVVGKALEPLASGKGVILVLVTLQ